ncbi:MAG: hypothetical protein ACJAYC_003039 [Halieaceae bacterium]|jgi:hypothetical protein
MDRLWNQLAVRHSITSQLIRHNFPGLPSMTPYQPLEKPPCRSTITSSLEKNIYNFAILVNRSPQVMLLAIDLHKDFVDVERVAEAAVLSFQSASVQCSELYAPEANRFSTYYNTAFSQ